MRTLLILLLSVTLLNAQEFDETMFSLQTEVQKEIEQSIQQEISAEMEEVKMWMDLYSAVEKEYIEIDKYPSELDKYINYQMQIIDKYLTLVEEAEILYYEQGDSVSKIQEAKKVLLNLKILRKIFNEYVEYKSTERSQSRLKLTEEAIIDGVATPRMHFAAYSVLRGEYPVEVTKMYSRIVRIKRYKLTYSNGDVAMFMNERLISVNSDD